MLRPDALPALGSPPARLTAACHCGKIASTPCPTLADMPAASGAIEALGWGWHADVGYACSAACAEAARQAAAIRQGRGARRRRSPAAAVLGRHHMPLFFGEVA